MDVTNNKYDIQGVCLKYMALSPVWIQIAVSSPWFVHSLSCMWGGVYKHLLPIPGEKNHFPMKDITCNTMKPWKRSGGTITKYHLLVLQIYQAVMIHELIVFLKPVLLKHQTLNHIPTLLSWPSSYWWVLWKISIPIRFSWTIDMFWCIKLLSLWNKSVQILSPKCRDTIRIR